MSRLITISFLNQSFRSSPNLAAAADAAALAVIRPVEAKYPALLFKQQLAAYVEKIFGMIRDNLKKELSALISLCIQVCPNVVTTLHFNNKSVLLI